jgi:hypothetical protein
MSELFWAALSSTAYAECQWKMDSHLVFNFCYRRQPNATPEYPKSDWFNIFVLHQNRVQRGQGAKNAVREDYLPPFLDLVVWGHEHECLPDPMVGASPIPFSQF